MAAPARWSAPISRSSGACPTARAAPIDARARPQHAQPRENGGRRRRARPARASRITRFEELSGPRRAVASLVRCVLETGRTHQIRVHMAHIGHPLLGDAVYGAGFKTKAARLSRPSARGACGLGRQALHAAVLGFDHPASGEILRFESALPPDMQRSASTPCEQARALVTRDDRVTPLSGDATPKRAARR